jgi:hypothetical protein
MGLKAIWNQFIKLFPVMLRAYIPVVVLVGVLYIVKHVTHIPYPNFTRDPAAITDTPAYYGLVSNIGILLWCSSAAIYLFSFMLLRGRSSSKESRLFILYLGLFTSLLLLDDFFLIHETIAEYLEDALGISLVFGEAAVFGVYGLLIIWLVIRFRMVLLNTDYIFLGLAVGFFLLSMITDLGGELADVYDPRLTLLEDTFKLCGIVGWFTYAVRTALKQVVWFIKQSG